MHTILIDPLLLFFFFILDTNLFRVNAYTRIKCRTHWYPSRSSWRQNCSWGTRTRRWLLESIRLCSRRRRSVQQPVQRGIFSSIFFYSKYEFFLIFSCLFFLFLYRLSTTARNPTLPSLPTSDTSPYVPKLLQQYYISVPTYSVPSVYPWKSSAWRRWQLHVWCRLRLRVDLRFSSYSIMDKMRIWRRVVSFIWRPVYRLWEMYFVCRRVSGLRTGEERCFINTSIFFSVEWGKERINDGYIFIAIPAVILVSILTWKVNLLSLPSMILWPTLRKL